MYNGYVDEGKNPKGVEVDMGYGYRSMRPEWKKDWAMEAEFDAKGVTLTLFSSDIWHYNQFYITFEALKAWRASGKFAADADWLRSEFVRQVLQKPEVADNMPHSGPRSWSCSENWLKPVPLRDHIAKYGEHV